MNAGDVTVQARQIGRKADGSKAIDHAVRVGIIAYGIVHLLIAWVAIQLAFGSDEGSASSDGALSKMAQTPVGGVLLYVVAAGFAALVLWQLTEAIAGHRDAEGKKRVFKRLGSGMKAVLYGALGWSALKIAMGGGSDGGGTDTITSKIMAMPGGQLLVGLVGVAVGAYAARLIYRGLSESFMDKLKAEGQVGDTGKAFVLFGKTGYVSKGLALFVVAGLFLWAAWTQDPKKSGGLDQALHKVLEQPFGMPMLVALGAGIACYGLFAFAWARHLDR
jgi:high-affinity Fe2+/Pb2+ permease